jgi:uncharacterized protein YfbU (UPF0304 family)
LTDNQPDLVLDDELLARVDRWRALQEVPFSRSQAVAELVRSGLREQGSPTFTTGEKLMLSILCDVSRKVGSEGMIDPEFLQSAIKGGHSWAIEWEHPSLSHRHTNSQHTADFVVRVLTMWRLIEDGFGALSAQAQADVQQAVGLTKAPAFPGWDSEHEANYKSTARFMTDKMDLFPMFIGRAAADSGSPTIDRYKSMLRRLAVYEGEAPVQQLTAEQLTDLLGVA